MSYTSFIVTKWKNEIKINRELCWISVSITRLSSESEKSPRDSQLFDRSETLNGQTANRLSFSSWKINAIPSDSDTHPILIRHTDPCSPSQQTKCMLQLLVDTHCSSSSINMIIYLFCWCWCMWGFTSRVQNRFAADCRLLIIDARWFTVGWDGSAQLRWMLNVVFVVFRYQSPDDTSSFRMEKKRKNNRREPTAKRQKKKKMLN